jgi:hypothetical protein
VSWSSVQMANNLPSGLWRRNGAAGFFSLWPSRCSEPKSSVAEPGLLSGKLRSALQAARIKQNIEWTAISATVRENSVVMTIT